jgi:hypothetical protein
VECVYFSDGWHPSLETRSKTTKDFLSRQCSAIRRDNRPNAKKASSKGTNKAFREREEGAVPVALVLDELGR